LLVIYTSSYVCSVRNLGLARRLAKGLAPKRETRVIGSSLEYLTQIPFKCINILFFARVIVTS
jgi:hypothetical protein